MICVQLTSQAAAVILTLALFKTWVRVHVVGQNSRKTESEK